MAGATLTSISVGGFRGIGPRRTLELKPGPGLTLVVGRNGSGKSSFAEGAEILLTGANWRWAKRSRVWREGWRNLHAPDPTAVEAGFLVEGLGAVTLARRWAAGAALDDGALEVRLPGEPNPQPTLDGLAWAAALEPYRPILSYNELGAMFEGPAELHDRLMAILGLGEYDVLAAEARAKRAELETATKATTARLAVLRDRLGALDDGRATQTLAALAGKRWNLDAVEALVGGPADDAGLGDITLLRALASVEAPSEDEVLRVAEAIRDGHRRREALAKTSVGRAAALAGLLRSALDFHQHHEVTDCPVCGTPGVLDAAWRERATAEATAQEALADEARTLNAEAQAVAARMARLFAPAPAVLDRAPEVGLAQEAAILATAWSIYATPPAHAATPIELADHLEATFDPVRAAAEVLREAADAELGRREGAWRPLAVDLAAWLPEGRAALEAEGEIKRLKDEEKALKAEQLRLKHERFAPVADQARAHWDVLRQSSSVELDSITLEGTATQRRVDIGVSVDGVQGAALGVMSQGELHAIALSLFLPRATMPESPFRFVLIDDPVQSMDPARVDGLARVLEAVAGDRQVIVFTHDDRLPEAARRLGIGATVLEVTRREGSVVEVRSGFGPVRRNLDDAWAVARDEHVPEALARQVVPGFCRAAIEAACTEAVRRRRLARGEAHTAVEAALGSVTTVTTALALALFDDVARANDVPARLKGWGESFADAWGAANRGAHAGYRGGSLEQLVRDTERLCTRIREEAKA